MCLMCGPTQLFLQCGPETPKGWTPLLDPFVSLLLTLVKVARCPPDGAAGKLLSNPETL